MDVLKKVPVREQDAKVRATNFEEVCLGYNLEEAICEASRCINCKNAQCVKGCPVGAKQLDAAYDEFAKSFTERLAARRENEYFI